MAIVDYRKKNHVGRYSTDSVELIETMNNHDADIKVVLKNGQEHLFRCSCAITFQDVMGITQVIIS